MVENLMVEIKVTSNNIEHYSNLGYQCATNEIMSVNAYDVPKTSNIVIPVKCDYCGSSKHIPSKHYYNSFKTVLKYACSNQECINKKRKEVIFFKYGENHYMNLESVKEKSKKTNTERFGVDNPMKNKTIINKVKKTNIQKYGVDNPLKNDEIKQKQKNSITSLNFESINKKRKETSLEKYGSENVMYLDEYKQKLKHTIKSKYDVDNVMYLDDVKSKICETFFKKYGSQYYLNSTSFKEQYENIQQKSQITRFNNLKEKYLEYNIVGISGRELSIICDSGSEHIFEIEKSLFFNRAYTNLKLCTICNDYSKSSGLECAVKDYIASIYSGSILTSDRSVIGGQELDIYLPDINIAFEFNGLYYHSELFKDQNYHLNKSKKCLDKNIQLIHIWEDDWLYKQDIVKSRIRNILKHDIMKVFARKCEIKNVSYLDAKNFLNKNHIQGNCQSKIRAGLYYNNNLIAIMTFGYKRIIMNQKNNNSDFELLRYCSEINTAVIGGASKLLKYFIKNYNPINIISYADRSWSNGNLYEKIGFSLEKETIPNYYYIVGNTRQNRFKYRKDLLVKEGYDKTLSEKMIMLSRKIYRIYDAGSYKYVLTI